MLKIRFYKFLSKFIPYFKRKMMSKIQERMHNAFKNYLDSYDKKDLFSIVRTSNSTDQNIVKYTITIRGVEFFSGIEYVNKKIEILFLFSSLTNCMETFSEINDFNNHFKSMNKENLLATLEQYQ